MIFAPLIDWAGFRLTPPATPLAVGQNLHCWRSCPNCGDADGEVHWYGDRTCFVCHQPTGVPA